MIEERERGVRRPWLPGCLRQHGLDAQDVQALSYVVIDEIIDLVARLVVWDWPAADGGGRLRFDRAAPAMEVAVPLTRLHEEVYAGRLERDPRIGDVFAAAIPARAGEAVAAGADPWDEPLAGLLGEYVYDVSREARTVAKLAFYGTMAPVVDAREAEQWRLMDVAQVDDDPAPRLAVTGGRGR